MTKRRPMRAKPILVAALLAITALTAALPAVHTANAALTTRQPDGRIRKGSGPLIGNNIYNTTAVGQTKTATVAPGTTVSFHISIQNDTNVHDSYTVVPTRYVTLYFNVKWLHGTTDITSQIFTEAFTTPQVAGGDAYGITVKVKVKAGAPKGASVGSLVTITSVGDTFKADAVQFTVTAS